MPQVVYTSTAVQINSAQLFAPTGDVGQWAGRIATQLRMTAKGYAPPRRSFARHGTWATGRMQRGIEGRAYWDGRKDYDIILSSSAPYTKYVHQGTASQGKNYIYTSKGYANRKVIAEWIKNKQLNFEKGEKGLVMPVTRVPFKGALYLRVKGQKANPFLTDAYYTVQSKHRSLPKLEFKRYGFENF